MADRNDPLSDQGQHIVLVGLMASSKTTVGRALAERLGKPFCDSDLQLSRRTGETAKQVAKRLGSDELHELEAQELELALQSALPSVIAAAASVVEDSRARELLQPHEVIWLRAPVKTLASRMRTGHHRPDFGLDPETSLREQAGRRDALYRSVADHVVETGDRDITSIVQEIAALSDQ